MKIKITPEMRVQLMHAEFIDITDIVAPIQAERDELDAQVELLRSIAEEIRLKLDAEEENSKQQRDMKRRARKERDELAAKLKILDAAAQQLSHEIACDPAEPFFKSFAELQNVRAVTPEACWANVQANAVLSAVKFCNRYEAFPVKRGNLANTVIAMDELTAYAEHILQGGKA